jgi:hypothetical protein
MNTLTNKLKILKAILAVQKDCPSIPRTKEATVISKKTGATYKYKYAPYDVVMEIVQPLLTENSLGITHRNIQNDKEKTIVETTLFHESGEFIVTTSEDSITGNLGRMSRIQTIGNLKTFIKRYNVGDLLNISVSDDTDGIGLGDGEKNKKLKSKDITQTQIITYQQEEKPKEEKPNPNYIYDDNGLKRYNKVTKKLNDKYQTKNNLITNETWNSLKKNLDKKEITAKLFADWLESSHKIKFFDIKEENTNEILNIIKSDPGQILDLPKPDNENKK